jgi:hypothetical protein
MRGLCIEIQDQHGKKKDLVKLTMSLDSQHQAPLCTLVAVFVYFGCSIDVFRVRVVQATRIDPTQHPYRKRQAVKLNIFACEAAELF